MEGPPDYGFLLVPLACRGSLSTHLPWVARVGYHAKSFERWYGRFTVDTVSCVPHPQFHAPHCRRRGVQTPDKPVTQIARFNKLPCTTIPLTHASPRNHLGFSSRPQTHHAMKNPSTHYNHTIHKSHRYNFPKQQILTPLENSSPTPSKQYHTIHNPDPRQPSSKQNALVTPR